MDGAVIAQWTVTGVIAVGLYLTWRQNGRREIASEERRAERWGALETEVANIKRELSNPSHGLGKIKESVDNQGKHCASVTSGFEERLKSLEEKAREG